MKWWIILILLVVVCGVQAQDGLKKIELRGFQGLNTRGSKLTVAPNKSMIAHNVDWGISVGAINTRKGYTRTSIISNMDSILSIAGAYYSDGTQQLYLVADSLNVGYGNIYVTAKGSADISSVTPLYKYWGIQKKSSFTMYGDNTYIVNGQQMPLVSVEGGSARELMPRAPGVPRLTPLKGETAPYLNGEYVYTFIIYQAPANYYTHTSVEAPVSIRVTLDSSTVFMSDFPEPTFDSIVNPWRWMEFFTITQLQNSTLYRIIIDNDTANYTSDASATYLEIAQGLVDSINSGSDSCADCTAYDTSAIAEDSIFVVKSNTDHAANPTVTTSANLGKGLNSSHKLYIYRSSVNPGRLESTDSVFLIKMFTVTATDSTFYDTVTWTDSTTEAAMERPLFTTTYDGRDSLGVLTKRYGTPGYISMDTTGTGIFEGFPSDSADTIGVAYACTFVDTIIGSESDTGRSLFVWNDINTTGPSTITVSLPRQPGDASNMLTNLYRANVLKVNAGMAFTGLSGTLKEEFDVLVQAIKEDCSEEYGWGWEQAADCNEARADLRRFKRVNKITYNQRNQYGQNIPLDSIVVGPYYLQGQYADTILQVTDSIPYDTLVRNSNEFFKSTLNHPPQQISVFNNRLWFADGSDVWRSSLLNNPVDSMFYFSQVPSMTLNASDGDQITLMFPARGVIRVFKNFANYNIFQDANLNWNRVEVSGTFGCIAPYSYAKGFNSHYYLSDAGVIRENEGTNLERTQNIELISAPIKSFDQMSLVDKSEAVGFYNDQKYMLYIPTAGTTYVYDERANAWSTWDLVIGGATKYGIESETEFFPGDTMYFFKDSQLFYYDNGINSDVVTLGSPIYMNWESGPIFVDDNYESISSFGVWSTGSTNDAIYLWPIDEDGIVYDTATTAQLSSSYWRKSIDPNRGLYFNIRVQTVGSSTQIDGIDVLYTDEGPVIVK